jgi:NAD(P)-dependent dehydrogenase (short-subunit alcohol dehydrogenase family)
MNVRDKVIVVTGGANGIGRALCERFRAEGAGKIVVADIDASGAQSVARSIAGVAMSCDVSKEQDIGRVIEDTERSCGPIGLFCSNAGVFFRDPDLENAASASNETWMRAWSVNVMAHVYAARALVPRMASRGGGHFLHTVSAAGLLSQIHSAVYSVTKHAALGFAESLAITHRDQGIKVSMLCPQGVETAMLRGGELSAAAVDGILTPAAVADAVMDGLATDAFLILPHPQVARYMSSKVENYDRWIGGMAKLRRSMPRPQI